MLSRKRKHNYIPDSQSLDLPKRAKNSASQHSSQSLSSTSQSSVGSFGRYDIKGIIGETEHEYLIDWADSILTGEVYESTWEPKENVDAAAVAAWESQRCSHLTESQISSKDDCASSFQPSPESYAHHQQLGQPSDARRGSRLTRSKALATREQEGSRASPSLELRNRRSLSVPLEGSDVADLLVRVSQADSLDRDLYVAYESSFSTQSTRPSIQASPKTKGGCNSPGTISCDGVVPDSQPEATSSDSDSDSKRNRLGYLQPEGLVSSISLVSAAIQSRYNGLQLLVPASQPSLDTRSRSTSAPPTSSGRAIAGSSAHTSQSTLARSHSDTGYLPAPQQQPPDVSPSSSLEIPKSAERRTESPDIRERTSDKSGHPTREDYSHTSTITSDIQHRPGSQRRLSYSKAHSRKCHSENCLGAIHSQRPMAHPREYQEGYQRSINDSQPPNLASSQQVRRSSYGNPPPTWERTQSVGSNVLNSTHYPMTSQEGPGSRFPFVAQRPPIAVERRGSHGWAQYINDQRDERRRHFTEGHHGKHLYQSARSAPQSPMAQGFEASRFPLDLEGTSRDRARAFQHPASPNVRSPITQSSLKAMNFAPAPLSPLHKTFSPTGSLSPDPTDRRMSKSPSVIPDTLPYTAEPEPSRLEARPLEIDTTFRQPPPRVIHPQSLPHTPITPSKLALQNQVSLSQDETAIRILNTSMREHYVALSMPGRIRDAYCNVVRFYSDSIRPLFSQNPCRPETIEGINKLLDGVSNVTTHLDLQGSGPSSGDHVDPQAEAAYAEACSEKFAFLGHLIDKLRHQRLNVFIAAKRGTLMNIIETFLKAKDVTWTKFDENTSNMQPRGQNGMRIFVIPSDGSYDTSKLQWPQPDTVIGFDETLSLDRVSNFHRSSNPVPIMRLLVYASLEHIDLCVPRDMNPVERLRRLVWILLQTQKRVGSLAEPTSRVAADIAASSIQNYAGKRRDRAFMLPEVPPIDDISLMADIDSHDMDKQPYLAEPNGISRYWPNPITPTVLSPPRQVGQKRSFDLVWGEPLQKQVKKLRMGSAYHGAFEDFQPQETTDSLMSRLDSAKQQINELERSLQKKTAFCQELEQSLSVRQYDFEKVRQENSDLKRTHAKATTAMTRDQKEWERVVSTNKILLDRNKAVEREFREIQERLQSHPNATIAANARDEVELDDLRKRNASLEKKIGSAEADSEYVRVQYQQASTAAAEASGTVAELESANAELQRKLDSDIGRFRQAADQDIHEKLTKRVQRLEAQIKQRDQLQQRLESEMAELRRGRGGMQTRGSSQQPRSPRGGGSRGVSPAPPFLGGHAMTRAGSGLGSRLGAG